MVLTKLRQKLLRMRAKAHNMTVPQYKTYLRKRKVEQQRFKEELRKKEKEERLKHEKWKIEEKYKQKRKATKKRKSGEGLGSLFGGGGDSSYDPLGLFGPPKRKRKKRKKRSK